MTRRPKAVTLPAGASPFQRELGQRLRWVRQARGLSLDQVERLSRGVFTRAAIRSYEVALREPTVETVARYAAFLGIPAAQILDPRSLLPARTDSKEIA